MSTQHFPLHELHIITEARDKKGSSDDNKLENAIFVKRKPRRSTLNTNIGYLDTKTSPTVQAPSIVITNHSLTLIKSMIMTEKNNFFSDRRFDPWGWV